MVDVSNIDDYHIGSDKQALWSLVSTGLGIELAQQEELLCHNRRIEKGITASLANTQQKKSVRNKRYREFALLRSALRHSFARHPLTLKLF